jgi:hypothetical protein
VSIKEAQTKYLQQIIANHADPKQPAVDLRQVAADPLLAQHPEIINQITEFQRAMDNESSQAQRAAREDERFAHEKQVWTREDLRAAREDQTAKAKQNASSVYNRINLPPGDPQRINSTDAIFDGMNKGDYGISETKELLKAFNDVRGPGGESIASSKSRFFGTIDSLFISELQKGTDSPLEHKEQAALYAYKQWVDSRIDAYRKENKDPFQLFNSSPKNADYLASPGNIAIFKHSMGYDLDKDLEGIGVVPGAAPTTGQAAPAPEGNFVTRAWNSIFGSSAPTTPAGLPGATYAGSQNGRDIWEQKQPDGSIKYFALKQHPTQDQGPQVPIGQ